MIVVDASVVVAGLASGGATGRWAESVLAGEPLAARWEGRAWPSARAHSHILSALPTGSFPGVDQADVFNFLERHEKD